MSIPAYRVAWKQTLPPHLKLVLVAIADFANDDGLCNPSYETIAKMCGLKRRQAIRSVKMLIAKKIIRKAKRWKHDRLMTSNYYIINGVSNKKMEFW